MQTYLRFGIVGTYQKKSELRELIKKKIGIVGTSEKIGIMGTYLY
jgi:hypothetical protein